MKHRNAVIILTISVLLFTAVFTTLLHMRHKTFFSHDWRDEAVNNQLIYNTSQGKLLYSTIKGPMIFHRHFRPIFLICAIPWVIYSHIQTWFFTVSLILAMGAFAIYSLARRRNKTPGMALGFALAYLTWPPLHEITLGNYDPETLVATFLLFAMSAYDSEKLRGFWIWILMALICKETMAVVLFGIGVMALFHRRKWVWWALPMVGAVVWFVTSIKLIIPIYHPSFDTIYGRFIGCETGVGSFPGCFISALVSQPAKTFLLIFSKEHWLLLWGLLRGAGIAGVIGLEWLIPALPITLMILVHKDPHPVRQAHILSSMLPFIFIAGMMGIDRISALMARISNSRFSENIATWALLTMLLATNVLLFFFPGVFGVWQNYGTDPLPGFTPSRVFDKQFYNYSEQNAQAWETIALIPDKEPVMTNNRFLLALSSRPVLREFGTQTSLKDFQNLKYLLISLIEPPCRTCTFNELNKTNLTQLIQLVEKGHYKVIRSYKDHLLLARKDIDGLIQTDQTLEIFFATINNIKESMID